jgi:transposase
MKKEQVFIGIDVSKATLDVCTLTENGLKHDQIANTAKPIKSYFKKLKKELNYEEYLVCMENTGQYNWPFYEALEHLDVKLYVVNALHLKRSMGMIRGKTDKSDALQIADHIKRHYSKYKPYQVPRNQIRALQCLLALRRRLMKSKKTFQVPLNELVKINPQMAKLIKTQSKKTILSLTLRIREVEAHIKRIIKEDPRLSELQKYITSVPGAGKVVAWNLLIKTNEFKQLNDPRKLACYAGVVPFEYQSGTSIKRRPRVSNMADKKLKTVLHMASIRAVRIEGELRDYYLRKTESGKNKMSVLNAVRNKILARVCAAVNNQRVYQKHLDLS